MKKDTKSFLFTGVSVPAILALIVAAHGALFPPEPVVTSAPAAEPIPSTPLVEAVATSSTITPVKPTVVVTHVPAPVVVPTPTPVTVVATQPSPIVSSSNTSGTSRHVSRRTSAS
jgi:hypothetical protein